MRRLVVDALLFGGDLTAFAALGLLVARGRSVALLLPDAHPLPEARAGSTVPLAAPGREPAADAEALALCGLFPAACAAAGELDAGALVRRAAQLLRGARVLSALSAAPLSAAREGDRIRSCAFVSGRFPFKVRPRLIADFTGLLARTADAPMESNPQAARLLSAAPEALDALAAAREATPAGPCPAPGFPWREYPRARTRYGAPAAEPSAADPGAIPIAPGVPFDLGAHRSARFWNLFLFGEAVPGLPPRDASGRILEGLLCGAALERALLARRADPPLSSRAVEETLRGGHGFVV